LPSEVIKGAGKQNKRGAFLGEKGPQKRRNLEKKNQSNS